MTIFDLVFIVVFLATVVMISGAAVAAVRGRSRRALGRLRALGLFLTMYFVVVVAVSLMSAQRVVHLTEPQCFDDWCIAVDQVSQTPMDSAVIYDVSIRLSSRARGRPQRENGVSVYLIDDQGRRYAPHEDPQAVPLDVMLSPGEAVTTKRKFTLPIDAQQPGLVVAHGRFPGIFIIGDSQSLFHKPTVVRFQ